MSKYAEKLQVLVNQMEGLMARVWVMKHITLKTNVLKDPDLSKLVKEFARRFPEQPDIQKVSQQGAMALQARAGEIEQDLHDYYYTFLDVLGWKEQTFILLQEVSNNVTNLKIDQNRDIMTWYMDLIVGYVQMHILVASIQDIKALLSFYARAYQQHMNTPEPDFPRLSGYIARFDKPIRRIQDEFQPISFRVGQTLLSLSFLFNQCIDVNILRGKNALSIVSNLEQMAMPVQDDFHRSILFQERMYMWTIYGFLTCPAELQNAGAMDLLKAALSEGWIVPVFRDEVLQIHEDYYDLFDYFRTPQMKLSKHKQMLKDATHVAVGNGGHNHRDRREYLKHELRSLRNVLTDCPGLLGPKATLVLCALSMARDEVLWFFRHHQIQPTKGRSKFKEDDYRDETISELIHHIVCLTDLLLTYKRVVQVYFVQFINGPDAKAVNPLVQNVLAMQLDHGVSQIIRSIPNDLANVTEDAVDTGQIGDILMTIRLNWNRALVSLLSAQSQVSKSALEDILRTMDMVVHHTKLVDQIDDFLERFASLKHLWWYRQHLWTVFDGSLRGREGQPLHCMSFLRVFNTFSHNMTPFTPTERTQIGSEAVDQVNKWLGRVMQIIESYLGQVGSHFVDLERQHAPVEAAQRMLQVMEVSRAKGRMHQNATAPPGHESRASNRAQLEKLRLLEKAASQICSAINQCELLPVFDYVFHPREYLRDSLCNAFLEFVKKHALVDGEVQRPSVLEFYVTIFMRVIKRVQNYTTLDVREAMRVALLGQSYDVTVGSLDAIMEGTKASEGSLVINAFSTWYTHFIQQRVGVTSTTHVLYSPVRKGFVSRPGTAFVAEQYTDLSELKSLCMVVGPYGVRVIDRDLLKIVEAGVSQIKNLLIQNKAALEEFARSYTVEHVFAEHLRKIRGLDSLVHLSTQMGAALCLRSLLHEALRDVMSARAPLLVDLVKSIQKEYPVNGLNDREVEAMDWVGVDTGFARGSADVGMRKLMWQFKKSTQDDQVFGLLPFFYAASFACSAWKDGDYKVVTEAHANNAHCMVPCIAKLLAASQAVTATQSSSPDGGYDNQRVRTVLETFVRCSAYVLCKLYREKKEMKMRDLPVSPRELPLPSMFVFLDKFVEGTEFVSRSFLEQHLPYALLRTSYLHLYEHGSKKDKRQQMQQELNPNSTEEQA